MITLAQWKPTRYTSKTYINKFGEGVNTYLPPFDIKDNELSDSLNMCSDDYPAISVRSGRSTYINGTTASTSPTLNGLGERNNQYLSVLDGRDWRLYNTLSPAWSTLSTTIMSANGKFVDFNLGSEQRTLLCVSSELWQYDGTAVTRLSTAPNSTNNTATNLIISHKQRAFMAFNKTVYYSALAKSTDWNTADDAGNITITNARGNITGLAIYGDHVIVFTNHSMHELYDYGSPSNWRLVDITNEIGCISDKTIIELKGVLYWLDYDGVYAYTGGLPKKISDKIDKYIKGINVSYASLCASNKHGDKLYISIPNNSTANNTVLVYDTDKNNWFPESGSIKYMTNIQDTLYGMNSTGMILNMVSTSVTDASTAISWSFETKAFNYNNIENLKAISDFNVVYKASTTFNIGFTTNANSTTYTTIANSSDFTFDSTERNKKIMLKSTDLANFNWAKFKFSGSGPATIHQWQVDARVKRGTD